MHDGVDTIAQLPAIVQRCDANEVRQVVRHRFTFRQHAHVHVAFLGRYQGFIQLRRHDHDSLMTFTVVDQTICGLLVIMPQIFSFHDIVQTAASSHRANGGHSSRDGFENAALNFFLLSARPGPGRLPRAGRLKSARQDSGPVYGELLSAWQSRDVAAPDARYRDACRTSALLMGGIELHGFPLSLLRAKAQYRPEDIDQASGRPLEANPKGLDLSGTVLSVAALCARCRSA